MNRELPGMTAFPSPVHRADSPASAKTRSIPRRRLSPRPGELRIDRRGVTGQVAEHDQAGLHVLGVGRERPPLEKDAVAAVAAALAPLHDLAGPDDRRHGVPAADDLAEGGQVRPDPVEGLDAARDRTGSPK